MSVTSESSKSHAAGRRWTVLAAVLAGVAGAAGFVGLHLANFYSFVAPIHRRAPAGSPTAEIGLGRELLAFSLRGLAIYGAFALAGAAMASKTRDRVLWALPALLYAFSTVPGMLLFQDRPAVRPLLDVYDGTAFSRGAGRWLVVLADLALVLLPGAIVAARTRPTGRRVDGHARTAFALCAVLGVLLYLQRQYVAYGSLDVNVEAHLPLVILFATGAALGVKRPWFPAVHVVSAFALSEAVFVLIDWALQSGFWVAPTPAKLRIAGSAMLPQLAAVGFGALVDPVARYLRWRRGTRAAVRPLASQPA